MKTPYGDLNTGDVYNAADGSSGDVIVLDVNTYAHCQDAVVQSKATGIIYRIDWFKLMMVRYSKEEAYQGAK